MTDVTRSLLKEAAIQPGVPLTDALWALQVQYYRGHLDVFMSEYMGLRLADTQQFIARGVSLATESHVVQNRSYGKTWLMAAIAVALALLYPGTGIGVVSSTIEQANLLINKVMEKFAPIPVVQAELATRKLGTSNKVTKQIDFLNGSFITSLSLGASGDSARGWRLKAVIVDEARLVPKEVVKAVIEPITLETRDIVSRVEGMRDYDSKIIYITSAYLKSCDYYRGFLHAVREMGKGNPDYFACAFDYSSCVRVGLRDARVFDRARRGMSDATFQMEYGSVFVGSSENSVFPFALTEPARVLKAVELSQRRHSVSRYVIAADLATSQGRFGDNACLCVLKLIEHANSPWEKELVCMKTYHGKNAEELRDEIRGLLLRFPGTAKLVVDVNGLGDCMPVLLDKPWIDPEEPEVEHPPVVAYESIVHEGGALPLLEPFVASNKLNNAMVNVLRYNLEQKLLRLPIHSAEFDSSAVLLEEESGTTRREAALGQFAVLAETDALQIEMGNLIAYIGVSGAIRYDVQKFGQHKDRFSALAMGMYHVSLMEEDARNGFDGDDGLCWGIATRM